MMTSINFYTAFSQTKNNTLSKAKSAYESNNFETYINIISNYKNNISNPDFEKFFTEESAEYQVMLIHSYISIKDNMNAQNQIELFFKYYHNKTSELYIQVREYELLIEKENIKEVELFNSTMSKKSSYYANQYLEQIGRAHV